MNRITIDELVRKFCRRNSMDPFMLAPVIEAYFGCPGSPHQAETPVRMGAVLSNGE
jgi:hypothetical protein